MPVNKGSRQPNAQCEVCSKQIYRRPCQMAGNVFCSHICYRIFTKPQLITCASCKKSFLPNKPTSRFCSHSCSNIARRGSSYSKDRHQNSSQQKIAVLRQAFEFSSCMVEGCDYANTLDVHRLLPGHQGGKYEIGNMFAICPNHHAEVSRGLIALERIDDSHLRISGG
jgi:hypothetical protein